MNSEMKELFEVLEEAIKELKANLAHDDRDEMTLIQCDFESSYFYPSEVKLCFALVDFEGLIFEVGKANDFNESESWCVYEALGMLRALEERLASCDTLKKSFECDLADSAMNVYHFNMPVLHPF